MSSLGVFASLAALMFNCVKKVIDYSPYEEGEWSTIAATRMDMYHSMGDALAQQYGGSAAHNTIECRVYSLNGKTYVHEFLDVNGRPVLIVDASKHLSTVHDPAEKEKLCVFLIEKALGALPDGGKEILGISIYIGSSEDPASSRQW